MGQTSLHKAAWRRRTRRTEKIPRRKVKMEVRRKHHHFLSLRHSSSPKIGKPSEAPVSILPCSLPHLSETSKFSAFEKPIFHANLRKIGTPSNTPVSIPCSLPPSFWNEPILRLWGGDGAHPGTWSLSNLGFPTSAAPPHKDHCPIRSHCVGLRYLQMIRFTLRWS